MWSWVENKVPNGSHICQNLALANANFKYDLPIPSGHIIIQPRPELDRVMLDDFGGLPLVTTITFQGDLLAIICPGSLFGRSNQHTRVSTPTKTTHFVSPQACRSRSCQCGGVPAGLPGKRPSGVFGFFSSPNRQKRENNSCFFFLSFLVNVKKKTQRKGPVHKLVCLFLLGGFVQRFWTSRVIGVSRLGCPHN